MSKDCWFEYKVGFSTILKHRLVDRLERCRPLMLIANFAILFWTFLEWLYFYVKEYYRKWSKPLWRV